MATMKTSLMCTSTLSVRALLGVLSTAKCQSTSCHNTVSEHYCSGGCGAHLCARTRQWRLGSESARCRTPAGFVGRGEFGNCVGRSSSIELLARARLVSLGKLPASPRGELLGRVTFSSQLVLRADGVARDGLGLVRDRFSRGREWGLVHSIGA